MKLVTGPCSMFGAKAEIAIQEKGLDYEVELVPFTLAKRYEPKHPEVLRVHPKAQVPLLFDGDLELFDSTLIFENLEDAYPSTPLWPTEPAARALARKFELKSDEQFFPHILTLISPTVARESDEAEHALTAAAAFYEEVDARLQRTPYLSGDSYGFTDIAFVSAYYFASALGVRLKPGLAALRAWRSRVAVRGPVQRVLGRTHEFLAANGLKPPGFLVAQTAGQGSLV